MCGSEKEVCFNKKSGMLLCQRHRKQIYNRGELTKRFKSDPNEIVIHDTYAEIIIYNKDNEEFLRTKIDLEDVDKVNDFKWSFKNPYIDTKPNGKSMYLHRYLMAVDDSDIQVDHINRDKLDNRKSNLRLVTNHQNCFNKNVKSDNTSGYSGVNWDKRYQKWRARIKNGREIHLGYFKTKEEAIAARKESEKKYFGEYAPKEVVAYE